MILFDATHTSHTGAQTGIQRVCRSLFAEIGAGEAITPVCYDPHQIGWRPLDSREVAVLRDRSGGAGKSRGAKWKLTQKISGAGRRWLGLRQSLPRATSVICPELFSAKVGLRLPELFQVLTGPRVAIFYDAIPLKYPELTPAGTVARFPGYLRELLMFDGVAAISEDSAASLRDYWRWLGLVNVPVVHAIPLGVDPVNTCGEPLAIGIPRILSVGTIEGRKNHLALLDAAEVLWREGVKFELELIGLARPDTAAAALAKIEALRAGGHPLIFHGSVSEAALHLAYAGAAFTVYPSLNEGFGLPVLESLQHGKPCVCSAHGALGEAARGGGCVVLESVAMGSLISTIRRLLQSPGEVAALVTAAHQRRYKTWAAYAREFTAWMQNVPRR